MTQPEQGEWQFMGMGGKYAFGESSSEYHWSDGETTLGFVRWEDGVAAIKALNAQAHQLKDWSKAHREERVLREEAERQLKAAREALAKIESGWKYPPGPGMRPPPEPLGRDGMRRVAREALSRLQERN